MTGFLAFLALATFGQLVLFFLSRLLLVPFARRLKEQGKVSSTAAADITITFPLLLQLVWVAALIAWLTQ